MRDGDKSPFNWRDYIIILIFILMIMIHYINIIQYEYTIREELGIISYIHK